jgi:hypothetical protein
VLGEIRQPGSNGRIALAVVAIGAPGGENTTLGVGQRREDVAQDVLGNEAVVLALSVALGGRDIPQLDRNWQQGDQYSRLCVANRAGEYAYLLRPPVAGLMLPVSPSPTPRLPMVI